MYVIESNIPVPERHGAKTAALKSLGPGQSVFFPNDAQSNIGALICVLRQQRDYESRQFTTRAVDGGTRAWRIK